MWDLCKTFDAMALLRNPNSLQPLSGVGKCGFLEVDDADRPSLAGL